MPTSSIPASTPQPYFKKLSGGFGSPTYFVFDFRKNEEQVVSGYSTTFSAAKKKLRVVLSSTEIFSCSFEPYSVMIGVILLFTYL